MKYLVEFKVYSGMVPYFIQERFSLIDGPKYLGVTCDHSDCYVPDTLLFLTKEEFIAKIVATTIYKPTRLMDSRNQEEQEAQTEYTEAEKETITRDWIASVGL